MDLAIGPKWSQAHWTLLFIILTPIGVVLLATFIFFSGLGLPDGTRNQGVLLTQPVDVSAALQLTQQTQYFAKQSINPWRFAVVVPSVCDDACVQRLWFIRQVRVALGKFQGRIENAVLKVDAAAALPSLENYQPIKSYVIDQQTWSAIVRQHALKPEDVNFYVIDPHGLVMMAYGTNHTYQQVIKDMKFLFKGVE